MNIQFSDIIALLILIAGFTLLLKGYDGYIQGIMSLIIGYYFGKRMEAK